MASCKGSGLGASWSGRTEATGNDWTVLNPPSTHPPSTKPSLAPGGGEGAEGPPGWPSEGSLGRALEARRFQKVAPGPAAQGQRQGDLVGSQAVLLVLGGALEANRFQNVAPGPAAQGKQQSCSAVLWRCHVAHTRTSPCPARFFNPRLRASCFFLLSFFLSVFLSFTCLCRRIPPSPRGASRRPHQCPTPGCQRSLQVIRQSVKNQVRKDAHRFVSFVLGLHGQTPGCQRSLHAWLVCKGARSVSK